MVVFIAFFVSACSIAAASIPARTVEITLDEALTAQNLLMTGLMTDEIQLSEAQFSSYLTELLAANTGSNTPVSALTVWFEPEQLHLRLTLTEGVLPAYLGNTLDLTGAISVANGVLQLELNEAAAGPYLVTDAFLQPVTDQINAALAQQTLGLPLTVTLDTGLLTIRVAP